MRNRIAQPISRRLTADPVYKKCDMETDWLAFPECPSALLSICVSFFVALDIFIFPNSSVHNLKMKRTADLLYKNSGWMSLQVAAELDEIDR